MFSLQRSAVVLSLSAVLALPAAGTWSIIVLDTATGEVGIAGATCLANIDLNAAIPVLRVGVGGACAQSLIDGGTNRILIWNGFIAGDSPADILADLAATDLNHKTRQYGIVDMGNSPVKFSGTAVGIAKRAVVGEVGTLKYAIQGNVLTSPQVVFAAEAALLASSGHLGSRITKAMEAARALGGDGRCSCSALQPTSCGAPPPAPFKSAHVGFMVLARMGDVDGICNGGVGCANGQYYLDLNVIDGLQGIDPVYQLRGQFQQWFNALKGSPDHIESTVGSSAQALVADGTSSLLVTVELADLEGTPLTTGGATVAVTTAGAVPPAFAIGPVTDHGDGSYSFSVTAGMVAETQDLVITADDGVQLATLYPYTTVRVDPAAALHSGFDTVSATDGASVPLTVNGLAGASYIVLGSLAGTSPGIALDVGVLPLNPDPFFQLTLFNPAPPFFVNTFGDLDASGRAEASFELPQGLLVGAAGLRFDWAAVVLEFLVTPGAPATITNGVGFDLVP